MEQALSRTAGGEKIKRLGITGRRLLVGLEQEGEDQATELNCRRTLVGLGWRSTWTKLSRVNHGDVGYITRKYLKQLVELVR